MFRVDTTMNGEIISMKTAKDIAKKDKVIVDLLGKIANLEYEVERIHSIAKDLKEYIEFLKQTDEVILEAGINKIIEEINEMLGSDKE